jgi:hypothetical protein
LIGLVEGLAQKAREGIGKTRTKLESNELRGQVYAYNEVLYFIKEYDKTQKEMETEDGSSDEMESVDSPALVGADGTDVPSPAPSGKMSR